MIAGEFGEAWKGVREPRGSKAFAESIHQILCVAWLGRQPIIHRYTKKSRPY
jgi:hypothetical protein